MIQISEYVYGLLSYARATKACAVVQVSFPAILTLRFLYAHKWTVSRSGHLTSVHASLRLIELEPGWCRNSSVGITTGYGLDDKRGRSSSPCRVNNFLHVVQTGSGVYPTSYPMDTEDLSRC
jgi:hypothetical protein